MDEFSLDNRHKLALPYWARPSIRLMAGAGKGGSSRKKADDEDEDEEDDDEDEDEEDDDEDEDEEDDDELDSLTDAELRDRLRDTQRQLDRASSSSAARRRQLRKTKRELEEARKPKPAPKGKPKGKDDEDAPDVESIKAEAVTEATKAANERIKKAEARGALRAAGVPAERIKRAVGLLNFEDLDVDDDGEVDGLDDALDELKKEWPEMFPKGKPTRRTSVAGGKDGDGRDSKPRRKPTATELQVAAATGRPIRR